MLRVGAALRLPWAGAVLRRPLSLAGLELEARLRLQRDVAFRAYSPGLAAAGGASTAGGATVSTLWEGPRPQGRNAN